MSGTPSRLVALGTTILLFSCASRRPIESAPATQISEAFTARVTLTLRLGGKGFHASGGLAVDPTAGVRLELRDPLGTTRLLLLVTPASVSVVDPAARSVVRWSAPDRSAPWGPADLWALFTGVLPPGARAGSPSTPWSWRASWRNGVGKVRLRRSGGTASTEGLAELAGPGGAVLVLGVSESRAGAPGPEAFAEPPGMLPAGSLEDLLDEALR